MISQWGQRHHLVAEAHPAILERRPHSSRYCLYQIADGPENLCDAACQEKHYKHAPPHFALAYSCRGAMLLLGSRLVPGGEAMTANEQEELQPLCVAVIQEKDPTKFIKLVEALNQFLQRREQSRKASAGALCAKPSDARTA
jgi:hypothetical protein